MGYGKFMTMSLSVSFMQKTVDSNADATRKAVDNQERGATAP
jgi:hypothetical protein